MVTLDVLLYLFSRIYSVGDISPRNIQTLPMATCFTMQNYPTSRPNEFLAGSFPIVSVFSAPPTACRWTKLVVMPPSPPADADSPTGNPSEDEYDSRRDGVDIDDDDDDEEEEEDDDDEGMYVVRPSN